MGLQTYSIAAELLLCSSVVSAQQAVPATNPTSPDDQYVPGPDSLPQPGVPTGKTFNFTFDYSKIFPGTSRTITVYVPAEYRADKPACVYVGLDGLVFKAPVVFDNLRTLIATGGARSTPARTSFA